MSSWLDPCLRTPIDIDTQSIDYIQSEWQPVDDYSGRNHVVDGQDEYAEVGIGHGEGVGFGAFHLWRRMKLPRPSDFHGGGPPRRSGPRPAKLIPWTYVFFGVSRYQPIDYADLDDAANTALKVAGGEASSRQC